jgi:aspartate/methionine/tyrosine aminotransferase
VTDRTRVLFISSPSLPTGRVATEEEWNAIASLCRERDVRLLYLAWFESIVYDGLPILHPAALTDMRDRTVIVSSVSLEQRMIAWRTGWVVAPGELVNDVSSVQIYNGLVPPGFNQIGARVALGLPDDYVHAANAEYVRRRDETMRQLDGLPAVRPSGTWSLLLDVAALDLDCVEVSNRLLDEKVAATPMRGWGGEIGDRHVRFVFSNEPVERLATLGDRVHRALEVARALT